MLARYVMQAFSGEFEIDIDFDFAEENILECKNAELQQQNAALEKKLMQLQNMLNLHNINKNNSKIIFG